MHYTRANTPRSAPPTAPFTAASWAASSPTRRCLWCSWTTTCCTGGTEVMAAAAAGAGDVLQGQIESCPAYAALVLVLPPARHLPQPRNAAMSAPVLSPPRHLPSCRPLTAVFDTAMLVNGHLYQLDQHLHRFLASAAKANIPLPPGMTVEQMRRTILETTAASCKLNGACGPWCRLPGCATGRLCAIRPTFLPARLPARPSPCSCVLPRRPCALLAVCGARRVWSQRQRVSGVGILLRGVHAGGARQQAGR